MNKAALLLICTALVGSAGLWWAGSSRHPEEAQARDASALGTQHATASVGALTRAAGSGASSSIEDAARLLELGAAGDLSVDMHTRTALDMLLAQLGPDATAADFQRLEEALRRSMPGEAATQAMALVRRYDSYSREAAAEATSQQTPGTADELKALQDKTFALRRRHFDEATARALFGAEEEQTRLDMALNAIQADPKLSAQEKAAQIAAMRERMPRDLPGMQGPVPASLQEMDTQVANLRQQGATPAQIEQLRSRYLGNEAARSMSEMEAQRTQWESRYQAYAEQKKAIVTAAAPDMAAQLDNALRQYFKEDELAAARAYDRQRAPRP